MHPGLARRFRVPAVVGAASHCRAQPAGTQAMHGTDHPWSTCSRPAAHAWPIRSWPQRTGHVRANPCLGAGVWVCATAVHTPCRSAGPDGTRQCARRRQASTHSPYAVRPRPRITAEAAPRLDRGSPLSRRLVCPDFCGVDLVDFMPRCVRSGVAACGLVAQHEQFGVLGGRAPRSSTSHCSTWQNIKYSSRRVMRSSLRPMACPTNSQLSTHDRLSGTHTFAELALVV
jgi:hypothetical protein